MDLVLTSFGMCMDKSSINSPFYKMPPLILKDKIPTLQLDYAALFIFDRLIIDESSYNHAIDPALDDYKKYYSQNLLEKLETSTAANSQILQSLYNSGRLIISNFDSIYLKNREKIDKIISTDLKSNNITQWIKPFELSINQWRHLLNCLHGQNDDFLQDDNYLFSRRDLLHVLKSPVNNLQMKTDLFKHWKRKLSPSVRENIRKALYDYLAYVNFNLILSAEFQAPFIDWADFQPFYIQKFKDLQNKDNGSQLIDHSRKLFELVFPYFIPKSNKDLLKVLEDKRIEKLRIFIQDAVNNKIEFDSKYVINILKEVLKFEKQAAIRRSISGWITLPLGFIPIIGTGVQKIAEETINKTWANKPLNEYSWFYLINNLDASTDII